MPKTLAQMRIEIATAERFFRRGTGDPAAIETARRNYAAGQIEDAICRVLATAPHLNEDQVDRLAALLRGGGGRDV